MIKLNSVIPYGKQDINEDDIQAVIETLKSDYLTQGPKILEFEEKFACYVGAKFAVAVSNGTAALHLSTLALDVRPGQKVLTTSITFAASANCVKYCGADIEFVDIDPETFLIDVKKIENILECSKPGTYCGIIPVDFAGRPVDLEALRIIASKYGLWIIEDACHAPGGFFIDQGGHKQFCGNGNFAELAIFSFHPVKHIASGEGGMITTNDEQLYRRLLRLRTHGITKNKDEFENPIGLATGIGCDEYPLWYMEMLELGFNYRLTDFQAALGISQLNRANQGLKRRREIASVYFNAFKDSDFIIRQSGVVDGHAYHLYVIEAKDRLGLYNFLRKNNILAQIHYFPCHLMPYYQSLGSKEGDCLFAEMYYKNCLSLPMYPSLTDKDVERVINTIFEFYVS